MHHSDLIHAIGNTPLVELKHSSPGPDIRLFAKLEGFNPTGSIKDRIARAMVKQAQREGLLPEGARIIEASTGNTGIALAMVGRALGYPVRIVMPENVFPEIPRTLAAYGADITWVGGDAGMTHAIELAREMAAGEGYVMLDQFSSEANFRTHYEETASEILADLGHVDALVAGFGTAGTLMGVGRRLKEVNPEALVIAVEPHPGNLVQGLRSTAEGFIPPLLDYSLLDGKILVRSSSAFAATARIMTHEAIFAGVSSGAVLHAAMKVMPRIEKGTVVLIFADSGWKYLNTPVWSAAPEPEDTDDLDDVMWW
jgi:[CysO sulfur-carrier protein]-thiocarboxylate-dependent cysteine synthase